MNPFKDFTTDQQNNQQFNDFIQKQCNFVQAETRLFPYTVDNPYSPIPTHPPRDKGRGVYFKFKTAVFGESSLDKVQRLKYYLQATSDYDLIRVNNYYSNSITNLGIGVSAPYTPTAIPWGGWILYKLLILKIN